MKVLFLFYVTMGHSDFLQNKDHMILTEYLFILLKTSLFTFLRLFFIQDTLR